MGTAKRERQKANRQLKLEELHQEEKSRKTKRRVLQFGVIIPLVVLAVFGGIWIFADGDDSSTSADTTVLPTVPVESTIAESTVPPTTIAPLPCPAEDGSSTQTQQFPAPPPVCIDNEKVYEATFVTNQGEMTLELDPGLAPLTVNNFVYLARYHYFDNTSCHRIITDFVVQCGDPTATGHGGPGYKFADELPADGAYQLGSVAMANSGPDTNGSQFFIITGQQGIDLAPNYSLFGKVTDGFDTTVAAMNALGTSGGTPSVAVTIESVTISVKEGAVASTTTLPTTVPATTAAGATSTSAG